MRHVNRTLNQMKSIAIVFFILVGIASCNDALDVEASNSLSGNQLVDDESIQQALVGAYFNLFGIADAGEGGELLGGDFQLMAELMVRNDQFGFSGDVIPQEIFWDESSAPEYENFVNKDIAATNSKVEANWRRAYETINLVNNILANIDKVSDNALRTKIQAEALAIRGILYFEMIRLWGPQYNGSTTSTLVFPLILDPITSVGEIDNPTKASVESIYNQAETDLLDASSDLESLGKNGTNISYYACQAYLARLSMQKNEYSDAETYLNNVLDGTFMLTTTPLDAFNNSSNSSEDILAIQQLPSSNTGSTGSGSGLSTFYSSLNGNGLSAFRINQAGLNSDVLSNNPRFLEEDLRGSVDPTTTETTSDVDSAYYRDPINTAVISSAKYLRNTDVVPLIRLAEIYLNRAESIFEQNTAVIDATALSDLNRIRTRAGLSELTAGDLSNDPNRFYDSLILERNRELIYEGIIFHDLKRQAANGLDVSITIGDLANPYVDPLDSRFILPIPQAECDASPGLCD